MPEEITLPDVETPVALNLEDVVAVPLADLSEDQTKFLNDNADTLTDEQKETFKSVLTPKEEEEEEIDLDKIEPEVRGTKPKQEADPKKGDDDDEIDPDDEKTISKVVKKELGEVTEALKQLNQLKDANEVDSLIRNAPEYSKYREVALKYMAHPAYANVPAKNIMAIVASNDLQKLGAQKEREAQKKAADTKGGGGQSRTPTTGKFDWSTASKEEFEAEKLRVMQSGNRQ